MIEKLLNINKFRQPLEQDPIWSYFPLRTSFNEELEKDTQIQKQSFLKIMDKQIDPLKTSRNELRMRKMAKEAQLTDGWFGMKQGEPTEDAKNNFLMLQLKKYMDPKNPAKSSDFTKMPKFFQIGTVVDSGDNEGAIHKIKKGDRKANLIDQFLELDKSIQFSKKKFGEIQKKGQKIYKFNKQYIKRQKKPDQGKGKYQKH